MIAIIDYGVGNIKAFANIYHNLQIPFRIVKNSNDFENISKIILPGVGSFDHAMQNLENSGMKEILNDLVLNKEIPVLGICVGMQMLAKSSEEGILPGLGWIDGVVKKFDNKKLNNMPLPHMGWNNINIIKKNSIFNDIDEEPMFYFLHSFYFECNDKSNIIATTSYGEKFASIINYKNIYGIQCHPEKSHHNGITILKNFGEL